MIRIKRVYGSQAPGEGVRYLVERLWPRGMKKEALHPATACGPVTLVYSARDTEHSSAVVLRDYLLARLRARAGHGSQGSMRKLQKGRVGPGGG